MHTHTHTSLAGTAAPGYLLGQWSRRRHPNIQQHTPKKKDKRHTSTLTHPHTHAMFLIFVDTHTHTFGRNCCTRVYTWAVKSVPASMIRAHKSWQQATLLMYRPSSLPFSTAHTHTHAHTMFNSLLWTHTHAHAHAHTHTHTHACTNTRTQIGTQTTFEDTNEDDKV